LKLIRRCPGKRAVRMEPAAIQASNRRNPVLVMIPGLVPIRHLLALVKAVTMVRNRATIPGALPGPGPATTRPAEVPARSCLTERRLAWVTNREQIWRERLAILKDALFSMLPGIVIFAVFLGMCLATGRIDAQWREQIRARRANVNNLAVDQLKDFAVIQAGTNQLDTLPKGIDSTRFSADNEAFVKFVDEYMNYDSWDDMYEKYNAAKERIGEYPAFWNTLYYTMTNDRSRKCIAISHTEFFGRKNVKSPTVSNVNGEARVMPVWQRAVVQDVHAVEIMRNGSYMYFAIVPTHRYAEDHNRAVSRTMCAGIWYSCDSNHVIKPEGLTWLWIEDN